MKTKLTCKHCGSNNILHCERMIVGYRVESFYIDENDSIQVNSFNENEHKVETNDIGVLLLLLQKARDEIAQMSRYGLEDRALLNDIDAALGKTVEDDQQAKGDV